MIKNEEKEILDLSKIYNIISDIDLNESSKLKELIMKKGKSK